MLLLDRLGRHVVLVAVDVEVLREVRVAVGGDRDEVVATGLVERREDAQFARLALADLERPEVGRERVLDLDPPARLRLGDVAALAAELPPNGIMSPREDLPSPVVVTVWGAQLGLDGADDERLALFLEEYGDGHTAPEFGVSCRGGTPDPQGGLPEQGTDA